MAPGSKCISAISWASSAWRLLRLSHPYVSLVLKWKLTGLADRLLLRFRGHSSADVQKGNVYFLSHLLYYLANCQLLSVLDLEIGKISPYSGKGHHLWSLLYFWTKIIRKTKFLFNHGALLLHDYLSVGLHKAQKEQAKISSDAPFQWSEESFISCWMHKSCFPISPQLIYDLDS